MLLSETCLVSDDGRGLEVDMRGEESQGNDCVLELEAGTY